MNLGCIKKIKLKSTAKLFNLDNRLLHSTSALRYPVFNDSKNYTGSIPSPLKSKLLWSQIEANLVPEMSHFTNTLVIPLGKNVDDIFTMLEVAGKLNSNHILTGFPHPSGANGHKAKQLEMNKAQCLSDAHDAEAQTMPGIYLQIAHRPVLVALPERCGKQKLLSKAFIHFGGRCHGKNTFCLVRILPSARHILINYFFVGYGKSK